MLEGIRVLELGQVLSAPFAGAILRRSRRRGAENRTRRGRRRRTPHGSGFPSRRRADISHGQPQQEVRGARPEKRGWESGFRTARGERGHSDPQSPSRRAGGIGHRRAIADRAASAVDLLRDFRVRAYRSDEGSSRLRTVDPGVQRPVQHQRRAGRSAHATGRRGVRSGHRHVDRDRRAGRVATAPNHRPRHHRHRVVAGNRSGLGCPTRRRLGQRGADAAETPLRSSRAGAVRSVRRERRSVHHLLRQRSPVRQTGARTRASRNGARTIVSPPTAPA